MQATASAAPEDRRQAAIRPTAETLDILRTLIAFPTVSRDSNLGLIEWVRDELARQGVASRLTYDAQRRKANLFATLGEGPLPGMILSGHTDVVPVDGQAWDTDPFVATERDGRIYGRGSADMKGFIAAALGLVPHALASPGVRPLHLALSYDEEVGCVGVRGMIRDLEESGLRAAGCLVGEPTGMRLVLGHKGGRAYRCCVKGREAHSALTPMGVNAIEYAALLIARLRELALQMRTSEKRHEGFDVPFTTMQTGVIKGGIASNVVAKDCEFRFDIRYLAWTDPGAVEAELRRHAEEVLLPQMREVAPESEISFEQLGEVPGFEIDAEEPLARYVRRLCGGDGTRHYVGFGTEAGLFQRMGVPSVICGPGHIEQAHKPNEFVALEQLAQCESFLREMVRTLPEAMLANPSIPS